MYQKAKTKEQLIGQSMASPWFIIVKCHACQQFLLVLLVIDNKK